jgi:hypothetical protein
MEGGRGEGEERGSGGCREWTESSKGSRERERIESRPSQKMGR